MLKLLRVLKLEDRLPPAGMLCRALGLGLFQRCKFFACITNKK